MKTLVTGVKGQLGYDVLKNLRMQGRDCVGADIDDFDVTNSFATESFLEACRPDAVIHCSAYTAVDKAEEQPELCQSVNVDGTRNLAESCKKVGAKMIFISTDYVFDGSGIKAHEVDDPRMPLNVYGKSKLAGEEALKAILPQHFIVRTSWMFGKNGNNFVKTMLQIGKKQSEVKVICDQIGSPTYTFDLAPLLCHMAETEQFGTYHATNEGFCSWADFAVEIFRQEGLPVNVNFIPTSVYPAKAKRPFNSRLSKECLDRAGFHSLPPWQDALHRYLHEIREQ